MMRQPQRGAIRSATQAGPLLCRGTRRQGWQTHIRLADMGVGAGIADLVLDPAGKRAHRRRGRFQELLVLIAVRHTVRLPGAGLTDWCFGKIDAETTLVIFSHCRTLDLVAFVQEAQPEGRGHIAENHAVFGPSDHRAR